MTHTRVAWHQAWRAAERAILSQLRALRRFGAPTYAQLQLSPKGFKRPRIAKATVRLQNVLSAGDWPCLLEEGRSALRHPRHWAPTLASTCSSNTASLSLRNPAHCWGRMGRLSGSTSRITPSFRCTKQLAVQNSLPYKTGPMDPCWLQKAASLGESCLLGSLGPGLASLPTLLCSPWW